jgi:hypothetical protein
LKYEKYDPLSLSLRVKEKINQKANRTGVQEPAFIPNKQSLASNPTPQQLPNKQLKEHFLDLLLDEQQTLPHDNSKETFVNNEKKLQNNGTKELFSPLNKGEEKKKEAEKIPFNFSIDNSALGKLELKGSYNGGTLILNIDLPTAMGTKEQATLANILKIKLSKELGVPLEIKIGSSRSN